MVKRIEADAAPRPAGDLAAEGDVKLSPPLTIAETELHAVFDVLDAALADVGAAAAS